MKSARGKDASSVRKPDAGKLLKSTTASTHCSCEFAAKLVCKPHEHCALGLPVFNVVNIWHLPQYS
jgi:hypothetical protein